MDFSVEECFVKEMRVVTIFFLSIISAFSYAQNYQFKNYTLDNGLPTEIIKSISQDSSGYFWAATDEGLVKFDGIQFTCYREALRSQYAKGLLQTTSGRLLLFGDLDLLEIKNQIDTVQFVTLLKGARNVADSTLWYPKAVYEDIHHDLWISEPQSITLLRDGEMHRYAFADKDRSPQFLRSFTCFEDRKGNLFTTSIMGDVFVFSREHNRFEDYPLDFKSQVWDVKIVEDEIYIGTSDGLYVAQLLSEGGFTTPVLKQQIRNISYLKPLRGNRLFIGTTAVTHYLLHLNESRLEQFPFSINNVNHAYLSRENDLWLSSNEGLVMAQENLIKDISGNIGFIEAIAVDAKNEEVYFANMLNLYKLKIGSETPKVILPQPDGYYQDLKIAHGGLWIANGFSVMFFQDNIIKKQFNFEKEGRFVTDLFLDSKKKIWFSQHNQHYAMYIDSSFQLRRIRVPIQPGNNINLIREGTDGMYVGSSGTRSYLFFKSLKDSVFRNISLPVNFKTTGDFNVTDLAFADGVVWMATTEGLIRYDHQTVEQVKLGEALTGLPAKTIEPYDKNSLLFATAKGLVRYDFTSQEYWLYDESTGMNSNTVTTRGLYIDPLKRVWIGTSKGLCYTENSLVRKQSTALPHIISLQVNGAPLPFTQSPPIPYGSFLSFAISSITFPENKVTVHYRMDDQETWKTISSSNLTLSELKSGNHRIEMRAKKVGGFDWSPVVHYQFKIMPPFWQQSWFFVLCFLAVMLIVFLSIAVTNIRSNKRRISLERKIEERTQQLKLSNEELSQRNNELDRFVYSASHDLSAPLKSILGLIAVARMDNLTAQTGQYLNMMESSVRKLESFINDVVNYSRNARLEVNYQLIPFNDFIQSIWSVYQYMPQSKKIRLEIRNELKAELYSDEVRLKIIFNNLISNGIKFHLSEKREDAYIIITARETATTILFVIEDNGQGIAEEWKPRIFDMFFRATQNTPGSGLGLYILKETILKMDGTVAVDSTLGAGTTFTIHFPKKTEATKSKQ